MFTNALFAAAAATQNASLDQQVNAFSLFIMKKIGITGDFAAYQPIVQWAVRSVFVILVLLLTAFLARKTRIQSIVAWFDEKIGMIELNNADRGFIAFLVSKAIWLGGFLVVLYVLKLNGLLATVGVSAGTLTAISALANKDLLGNVAAGFVLQSRQAIQKNDSIKVMSISGRLRSMGLTSCQIEDFDGTVHFIPNNKLLNEVMTNYSMATYRRATISFWYDPEAAHDEHVEMAIDNVFHQAPGLKEDSTPSFRYGDFNEKGQEVVLSFTMDTEDYSANASHLRAMVRRELEKANIQIGIPQYMILQADSEEA